MSNVLITIGDSFTYGEGLQFHLWKQSYPSTFNAFCQKTTYEPCQTISSTFDEYEQFRKKHNYTGILSRFLKCESVSNFGNGGSNLTSIETLDKWINYLRIDKSINPLLCVFQFTNIIRDIHSVSGQRQNGVRVFGEELYESLQYTIARLNTLNPITKSEKVDLGILFDRVFQIILLETKKRFRILEDEFGIKTIYFLGPVDGYSNELVSKYIMEDSKYLPIYYNSIQYHSWDIMNRENKWTLREKLGVNDDHPCLESHQWLASQLYKKYLEISQ
jgi:hypothetical protein